MVVVEISRMDPSLHASARIALSGVVDEGSKDSVLLSIDRRLVSLTVDDARRLAEVLTAVLDVPVSARSVDRLPRS